jgi:hypothetical protein
MIFKDLIRRKRDGSALTQQNIAFFVRGLTDSSIPTEQVAALAMGVFPLAELWRNRSADGGDGELSRPARCDDADCGIARTQKGI